MDLQDIVRKVEDIEVHGSNAVKVVEVRVTTIESCITEIKEIIKDTNNKFQMAIYLIVVFSFLSGVNALEGILRLFGLGR